MFVVRRRTTLMSFEAHVRKSRVLPVQPEAADVVVAGVDLRQQLRNLLGRILQVGVERDDDLAAHPLERRHDRHVLAVVGVEIDDAGDVGPRGVLGAEQFERTVGAAVVGEDDLVGLAESVEHGVEAGEERRQVRLLVVDGDDDGKENGGRRGGHGRGQQPSYTYCFWWAARIVE